MAREFTSEDHVIVVNENAVNIKRKGGFLRPVRDLFSIPLRAITNVYIDTPFTFFSCEATVTINTIDGQSHTFYGMSNPQARDLHKLLIQ